MADATITRLKELVIKDFVDSVEALDARKLPRWISDGKKLQSSLKSVEASLTDMEGTMETKKRKAMRTHLRREIARLYSCIEDCLEPMEAALSRLQFSGRFYVWNPERRSTKYLQFLSYDVERIIVESQCFLKQKHEIEQVKSTVPAQVYDQEELPSASGSGDRPVDLDDRIMKALLNEKCPVICIYDNSGMYSDQYWGQARDHFEAESVCFIDRKDIHEILQEILLDLIPEWRVDRKGVYEIERTHECFNVQKEKKCLIVLINVCTEQDWQSICVAFPIGDEQTKSKILVTTPSKEVAEQVAESGGLVFDTSFTQAKCLEMLTANPATHFDDPKLRSIGKAIFNLCEGSVFIATVLANTLMTETITDQLLLELASFQIENKSDGVESNALDLVYDRLPRNELKQCLLCMGQFPQGHVQGEKLYLLLAAEDLVMSPDNLTSGSRKYLERNILNELQIKYSLVFGDEDNLDPEIMKSFQLLDLIRDFCISQGLLEELFNIVDFKGGKHSRLSASRLAIYLSNYREEDATSMRFRIGSINQRRICSLLIFDTIESQQKCWPPEIRDLEKFLFLRVLDFDGVDFRFRKFPKGIDKLVLLRYLSFQGCYLEAFPYPISNFPCLETLDLRVRSNCKLIIPNVLHKMKRLRHLYFPMAYKSADNNKLQLLGLEKLEILVNFDTRVCNVQDLRGLNNIKILTVVSQENNNKDLDAVIQFSGKQAEAAECNYP